MSANNERIEEKMEKQREIQEREKQYDIVTSLDWKNAGFLFVVIITSMSIYAAFFS